MDKLADLIVHAEQPGPAVQHGSGASAPEPSTLNMGSDDPPLVANRNENIRDVKPSMAIQNLKLTVAQFKNDLHKLENDFAELSQHTTMGIKELETVVDNVRDDLRHVDDRYSKIETQNTDTMNVMTQLDLRVTEDTNAVMNLRKRPTTMA